MLESWKAVEPDNDNDTLGPLGTVANCYAKRLGRIADLTKNWDHPHHSAVMSVKIFRKVLANCCHSDFRE